MDYTRSQPYAEAQCNALGGTLSGIQNTNERLWMTYQSEVQLTTASGCLWIGAKRTAACMTSHLTDTCSGTTSFEWTDNSATGVEGFQWRYTVSQQPDNANLIQNWGTLITTKNTGVQYLLVSNGLLDDLSQNPQVSELLGYCDMQGFVCGKKPSIQ